MPWRARAQIELRPERPNIVVFLADDLGWGDLGAYGQAQIRTPRIDAIASQGMLFRQAYAGAPVCAPSRCVLMTGLHGGHCPIEANITPNAALRPDEITIARLLDGAGYRTAIVGKWGLGGELPDGTAHQTFSAPWGMGFDESFVVLDQIAAHEPWPAWVWRDGARETIEANLDGAEGAYAHDLFAEEAIAFLERAARRPEEPFFLFVAYTLPHREVHVPPEGDAYLAERWPAIERAFASMVSRLDADVGRVVERLDALGLGDRTLVIVASDNGPQQTDGHRAAFFDSNGPLRGNKRDLYEGGIRIPMVARWPGVVPEGAIEERAVGFVDVLPTLTDLAGLGVPRGLDGVSIAPLLRGQGAIASRTMVWACTEGDTGFDPHPTRFATRVGDLKLVERNDGAIELYDLARDPGEQSDRSGERPAEVAAMLARRQAEVVGPPPLIDPVIRVIGEGVIDEAAAPSDPFVPVLHLRFDGDPRSASGVPVIAALSALDAPPMQAAPARGIRYEAEVRAAEIPANRASNALSARFVRAERHSLALAPHPAISFGACSVTIEAWLRLASLEGPQWLLYAKPIGRDERHLDLGVRVRDADPARGIALVLGDPTLRAEPWSIESSLAIADTAWHRVVIRLDVEHAIATFDLDGAREEIAFRDRGHLVSSGPLLIGARHDEAGAMLESLDGWLDELRISRGIVPDDRLLDAPPAGDRGPSEAVLDLGEIRLGSPPILRTIEVVGGTDAPARLLAGSVETAAIDDRRLAIDAPSFRGLASGAGRARVTIRFSPDALGALWDQSIVLYGTVEPFGYPARRSPLRLRIEGRVVARAPMDAGVEAGDGTRPRARARSCAIDRSSGPGAAPALLAIAWIIARRRSARRRASARSPGSRPCAPRAGSRGIPAAHRETILRG